MCLLRSYTDPSSILFYCYKRRDRLWTCREQEHPPENKMNIDGGAGATPRMEGGWGSEHYQGQSCDQHFGRWAVSGVSDTPTSPPKVQKQIEDKVQGMRTPIETEARCQREVVYVPISPQRESGNCDSQNHRLPPPECTMSVSPIGVGSH